jgi:hypothetical protein
VAVVFDSSLSQENNNAVIAKNPVKKTFFIPFLNFKFIKSITSEKCISTHKWVYF